MMIQVATRDIKTILFFEDDSKYVNSFQLQARKELIGHYTFEHSLRLQELTERLERHKYDDVYIVDINMNDVGEGEYGGIEAIKAIENIVYKHLIINTALPEKDLKRLLKENNINIPYLYHQKIRFEKDFDFVKNILEGDDFIPSTVKIKKITFNASVDFNDFDEASRNYFSDVFISPAGITEDYHFTGKVDFFPNQEIATNIGNKEDENTIFHLVDDVSDVVEGIVLTKGEKKIHCYLPKEYSALRFIKKNRKIIEANDFNGYILRAFLTERLSFFFRSSYAKKKPLYDLIETIFSLTPKMKLGFLLKIWESITIRETLEADTTNKILHSLLEKNIPEIVDIFYGEVIDTPEDDLIEVKVCSVQNIKSKFNRVFMRRSLDQYNVGNIGACFKLYVIKSEGDNDIIPVPLNNFFAERIPLNVFEHKTKNH